MNFGEFPKREELQNCCTLAIAMKVPQIGHPVLPRNPSHSSQNLVGNLKREQSIKSLSSCSKIGPSERMTMLRYQRTFNRGHS